MDRMWVLTNSDTNEELVYPSDPRLQIKVDEDIQALWNGIPVRPLAISLVFNQWVTVRLHVSVLFYRMVYRGLTLSPTPLEIHPPPQAYCGTTSFGHPPSAGVFGQYQGVDHPPRCSRFSFRI